MQISGFTIVRNALKYNYPALESIRSILPICDEFIVNVGDSDDETLNLIHSLKDPKIKIIQTRWDMAMGKEVLSYQTNLALKECRGDWAFYLQSDELIHEKDLPKLSGLMQKYLEDTSVDAFRLGWLHFYGSYYRYRVDHGWFQKQDRIIRNNGNIFSHEDAWGFARWDGKPLQRINTGCLLYHYGWVHPPQVMSERVRNAEQIGFASSQGSAGNEYSFGDLSRFPAYFGTHPSVMKERIEAHRPSQDDLKSIRKKYWWNPLQVFKVRFKTGKRKKLKIN